MLWGNKENTMKYIWEDVEFWKDTANRAIWTFCESAFGMITIGQAFTDINWLHIFSVSGVAAIATILKCIYVSTKRIDDNYGSTEH